MTMARRMTMLILGAALAACGDAGSGANDAQGNVAAPSPSRPNAFHDRLMTLGETDRALALRRAVQDDGGSCRRVLSSAYQEEYKDMRMWTLRCQNGRDWAIFVGASGRVQARSCADNAKLGLPVCRLED